MFSRARSRIRLIGRFRSVVFVALLVAAVLLAGSATASALIGGVSRPISGSSVDLQKGLVGAWNLDGSAHDSSPYATNGTVTGATPTVDRKGKPNGAYAFDGSSNIDTGFTQTLNSFTFSIWIDPTNLSGGAKEALSSARDCCGAYNGFDFNVAGYGNARVGVWSGSTSSKVATATSPPLNTWTQYVGTYDGATIKLYNNGVLASSTADVATIGVPSASIKIGRCGAIGGCGFIGSIDDVRLWKRALNANEVSALYSSYDDSPKLDTGETGLVSWWKMDGNAKDASPYALPTTSVQNIAATADRKGIANAAYAFSGTGSCIYAASVAASNPMKTMTAGTISAWIDPTLSSPAQIVARVGANSDERMSLYFDGTYKRLFLETYTGSAWPKVYSTGNVVALNQWSHVAVTVSVTNTVSFYVNGVAAGTGTDTTPGVVANSFAIGSAPACSGQLFGGAIDDVRVYNRALAGSEIANQAQLYNPQLTIGNLQKGLIGYWPMNGNAKDVTPFANSGTVSNASLTSDRKGRANSAYSFASGSASLINIGSPSTYANLATTGFTYSLWVDRTGTTTYQWPQIMGAANTHIGYGLRSQNYGDGVNFEYGTSPYAGTYAGTSSVSLPLNTWHLLTVTYDGSNVKLYLDATLKATNAGASLDPTFQELNFSHASQTWSGGMDDARVYNRPLSPAEITRLYTEYQ